MTTSKGVVVVSPESTSKSRYLDSIELINQVFASFEKFLIDRKEEARKGEDNTKKSW